MNSAEAAAGDRVCPTCGATMKHAGPGCWLCGASLSTGRLPQQGGYLAAGVRALLSVVGAVAAVILTLAVIAVVMFGAFMAVCAATIRP